MGGGIKTEGKKNKLKAVSSADFSHTIDPKPQVDRVDSNLNIQGYVKVTPTLSMYKVIHVDAPLKPYLELNGAAKYANKKASVDAKLYAGLDIEVGGSLGIKIGKKKIGPHKTLGRKTVLEQKKQIWSKKFV